MKKLLGVLGLIVLIIAGFALRPGSSTPPSPTPEVEAVGDAPAVPPSYVPDQRAIAAIKFQREKDLETVREAACRRGVCN